MNDHIAKPIKVEKLYEKLIQWLRPDAVLNLSPGMQTSSDPVDSYLFLDGVDVRNALNNMNGDQDLYLRVLEDSYKRFRDIAGQIQAELDGNNLDTAKRLAHTVKGVSGTMGANALHKKSLDLESAIANNETDRISKVTGSFSREVNRVMTALEIFFREKEPQDSNEVKDGEEYETIDIKRLKEVFQELACFIDEANPDALDLIGEIKSLLGSSGITDDVRKLEVQIDEYEFEDAAKTLDRIYEALRLGG